MSRTDAARTKREEGPAISPQNAVHYGLNAVDILIPGEDPAEYELLLEDLVNTYIPGSLVEFDLISELAATRWRMRRLPQMEKAAHYAAAARVQNNPENAKLTPEERKMKIWNEVTNGPEMKQIHRHETRLRRAWEKAKAELEALIEERSWREQAEAEQAQAEAEAEAEVEADNELAPVPSAQSKRPAVQNEPNRTPHRPGNPGSMPLPEAA